MRAAKSLTIPALVLALVICAGTQRGYAGNDGQYTMPLRGFGTLRAVLASGTIDCLAPDGTVVAQFPAEFDALARYTALGRTVGTITADTCDFNPANGTLGVAGAAYQTAANGDEVYAPYVGVFQPDFSFSLEIEVAGGTGRFADACGAANAGGVLDPATGAGETWLDGWISIVGTRGYDPCD